MRRILDEQPVALDELSLADATYSCSERERERSLLERSRLRSGLSDDDERPASERRGRVGGNRFRA